MRPKEFDLSISDMDSGIAEFAVKTVLQNLPGMINVLLVGRSAFIRYDPRSINQLQICDAVSQAGYHPTIFQESMAG